jgi:outer membrane protein OmpA-like peptidoglycan-associated protein
MLQLHPNQPTERRARPANARRTDHRLRCRLESAAYKNLRQMALAMKSDALSSCKFVVEGHTDASGGTSLNLQLSKKRAYAVREFLVSMAINSSRLVPVGKGEAEPLPKRDPHAAENRRVQFRIIQN